MSIDRNCNLEDLLEYIRNNKIVIYGCGFVSKLFYERITDRNLNGQVSCYVTTEGSGNKVNDLEVFSVEEYSKTNNKQLVCIACHESLKAEIEQILQDYNKNLLN